MKIRVSDLKPAPYNPRKISQEKLDMLGKAMEEFGDLSGIVFNIQTGNLLSGHQRMKKLDPDWKIEKKLYSDSVGTVAIGFIETPFGLWNYREVNWNLEKELAGNIAANTHGGEWDFPLLKEVIGEIDTGAFNIELTGFTEIELKELFDFEPKNKAQDIPTMYWILLGVPLDKVQGLLNELTILRMTEGIVCQEKEGQNFYGQRGLQKILEKPKARKQK